MLNFNDSYPPFPLVIHSICTFSFLVLLSTGPLNLNSQFITSIIFTVNHMYFWQNNQIVSLKPSKRSSKHHAENLTACPVPSSAQWVNFLSTCNTQFSKAILNCIFISLDTFLLATCCKKRKKKISSNFFSFLYVNAKVIKCHFSWYKVVFF